MVCCSVIHCCSTQRNNPNKFSFHRVLHISTVIHLTSSYIFMPKDDQHTYISSPVLHKNIANIEELPHHVLIVYGNYFCSGSLIRSQVVVTVASCFKKSIIMKAVVKVGASTVTGPGQVIPVIEIKIHEYYKHSSEVDNDIALLALKDHALFGPTVKKIILVDPDVALRVGTTIDVSGWGYTNLPAKFLNYLVWSEMTIIHKTECQKHYEHMITSSHFCAKYQIERRLSDNGGPAMYRDLLMGMLSFGGTKRDEPHVAVFTNASYFYRWINLNSRRFQEKYCADPERGD